MIKNKKKVPTPIKPVMCEICGVDFAPKKNCGAKHCPECRDQIHKQKCAIRARRRIGKKSQEKSKEESVVIRPGPPPTGIAISEHGRFSKTNWLVKLEARK